MSTVREWIKGRLSVGLRRALRTVSEEISLQRRHRASVRKARGLAPGGAPIRLNLGSGQRPIRSPGWINVDLSPSADLQLDLREPLPFADESIAEIYTEHFLEHLDLPNVEDPTGWEFEAGARRSDARSFLRECHRVLARGGVLDVVVPDAECIVTEYAERRHRRFPAHEWWGPKWCTTPMHCVNYVFRQGREHKYAYDEETLSEVLRGAGFTSVARRPFDPARDAENHAIGSLCMHAVKLDSRSADAGASIAPRLSSSAA